MGEKIIIMLLIHILKMLVAMKWERSSGANLKSQEDAITQAEAYLRAIN